MTLEMSTDFGGPAGGQRVQTAGQAAPAGPAAGGGINDLLLALIRRKQQAGVPAQQMAAAQPAYREPERPAYRPQMGQAPIQSPAPTRAPATRMRRVQIRTPLPSIMEAKGLTYDEVPETQLADGSWSLDAVHGTLAGNEAAARQKMDILYRDPGGHGGGSSYADNGIRNLALEKQRQLASNSRDSRRG